MDLRGVHLSSGRNLSERDCVSPQAQAQFLVAVMYFTFFVKHLSNISCIDNSNSFENILTATTMIFSVLIALFLCVLPQASTDPCKKDIHIYKD